MIDRFDDEVVNNIIILNEEPYQEGAIEDVSFDLTEEGIDLFEPLD